MGYSWLEHNGKKILYLDYSQCKDSQGTIALLEEAAELMKKAGTGVYTLDNYEGGFATEEFMKRAKELGDIFSKYRIKGAAIGVVGIKNLLLRAYNTFAKDKIVPFNSKEEALNYLTKE